MSKRPLALREISFRGVRSRRLGELTLLRLDKGSNIMDIENLKRQTEQLRRDAERLEAKDRPKPIELIRLQRRARELDRRVSRAEEIKEMREEMEEA